MTSDDLELNDHRDNRSGQVEFADDRSQMGKTFDYGELSQHRGKRIDEVHR